MSFSGLDKAVFDFQKNAGFLDKTASNVNPRGKGYRKRSIAGEENQTPSWPPKDPFGQIKNLPKVKLLLANNTVYDQEGTIETINSMVNNNTGSVSFRAVFDNPNRILSNGNSGKIQIPQNYTDAVVIPQQSTYEQQGSTYVYKVGADNTAISTKITISTEVDNLYVVSSGVEKGDRIVATGVGKLRSNAQIQPQEVPFDSIAKPMNKVFK